MSSTLTFLSGASEVGRVAGLLEGPSGRLLLDYGMQVGHPPIFPPPAPPVDALLLTHAHADHSGIVPAVTAQGAELACTPLTGALAELLTRDSLKIAGAEGHDLPYGAHDIADMVQQLRPLLPDRDEHRGGFAIRAHNAGHIPGALMFEFPELDLLFTGDLNTRDTGLTRGARPRRCRTLVLEATYAGRDHPPRTELEERFRTAVCEVVDRGGTAVIPAFAVGRSQEVLMLLADLGFEMWLDGMGREVARQLLQHPRSLRDASALRQALDATRFVRYPQQRRQALRGDVIVTTSGMLEGGPVLGYAGRLRHDERSALLLTGYQVPGTNGRTLLDIGKLRVARERDAAPVRINMEVRHFDLSAHAGHAELASFARACRPERVVLYHGEQREALSTELAAELAGECEVLTPMEGEPIALD